MLASKKKDEDLTNRKAGAQAQKKDIQAQKS
jgi:hypothetical protein